MYIKNKLSNGIRVVFEVLPEIKSVTLGIWVKAGSAFENCENNGVSHFIEHMMFKGTSTRNYKQIAETMDNIGGQLNAFTAKECTCYYAKVIDEKQCVAADLLTDMLVNSIFDEKEIEKEKGVIIEEILMNEDDPEDVAHENLTINYFKGTEYSKTILGKVNNIKNMTRNNIVEYISERYTSDNIVIVAVGNVDANRMLEYLDNKLSTIKSNIHNTDTLVFGDWSPKKQIIKIKKETEQINICMGLRGYNYHDKRKYALSVISNVLGGSMSSRLFQKIREEKGAAYSIYTYPTVYSDVGMLSVYAGTSPKNANDVIEDILNEMTSFKMSDQELYNTKEQLRGNYILSQESMSSKMNAIGKSMLLKDNFLTEDEILSIISSISISDIKDASEYIFDKKYLTQVYVGNIEAI